MNYSKQGSIILYTLFLTSLALIMAVVIQTHLTTLFIDSETEKIDRKISENIIYKTNFSFNLSRDVNETGSGFTDTIGCPTSITMSGNTSIGSISSSLVHTGGLAFCSGIYGTKELKIFFNSGATEFETAEYENSIVSLTAGIGSSAFSDTDSTKINFGGSLYLNPDGIDDDFNSDDYRGGSTGSILYPSNYIDDDDLARRMSYGYILPGAGFSNIFWSNSNTSKIIDENINTSGAITLKQGDISDGVLRIDIDGDHILKLAKFDRLVYDTTRELVALETFTGTGAGEVVGYLQNIAGDISVDPSLTGNEYLFDFTSHDYAVFLQNTGTGVLLYKVTSQTPTGSGVYINPIDDSGDSLIMLGTDMIINNDGSYIGKEFKIEKKK